MLCLVSFIPKPQNIGKRYAKAKATIGGPYWRRYKALQLATLRQRVANLKRELKRQRSFKTE